MKKIPIKNVIALLLFFVFIYVMISQMGRHTSPVAEKGKRSKKRRQKAVMAIPDLAVNLLERQPMTTRENGRNIFRYGPPPQAQRPVTPPPPKPPGPPGAGHGGVGRPGLGAGHGVGVKPSAPPKKIHPPINFKYLGSFGPEGRMLAVISNGEEIQDVFEGEVFMKDYIVTSIGLESVTIGFVGFPDTETEILEVGS